MLISKEIQKDFKDHIATIQDLGDIKVITFRNPNCSFYYVRYVFDNRHIYVTGDIGDAIYDLTWIANLEGFAKNDINEYYFHEKLSSYEEDSKWGFNKKKALEDIKSHTEDWLDEDKERLEDLETELKELNSERAHMLASLAHEKVQADIDEDEVQNIESDIEGVDTEIENVEDEIKDLIEAMDVSEETEVIRELEELSEECSSYNEWCEGINSGSGYDSIYESVSNIEQDAWEWIYDMGKCVPGRVKMHLAGLVLAGRQLYPKEGYKEIESGEES